MPLQASAYARSTVGQCKAHLTARISMHSTAELCSCTRGLKAAVAEALRHIESKSMELVAVLSVTTKHQEASAARLFSM